jgi:hypothetical protein
MNCDDVRRHWNLYHDSEGDAALHLKINEHLASCSPCAEWFCKQSQFEDLLTHHLASGPSDPDLWPSVLAGAGLVTPASRNRFLRPVVLVACLAATLLIALTVGLVARLRPNDGQPSLSVQAADWHTRLADGEVSIPFRSESDLEIEEYLRHQVSFAVRCPPRSDAGFAVRGAGTCQMAGEQAAYLVGNVERTPVSIFILSRDSLRRFPQQQAALGREAIHECREGNFKMALRIVDRNLVLVIGQGRDEQLLRVLRAYGSYPHQSSSA